LINRLKYSHRSSIAQTLFHIEKKNKFFLVFIKLKFSSNNAMREVLGFALELTHPGLGFWKLKRLLQNNILDFKRLFFVK
jgi:hypothetical protein